MLRLFRPQQYLSHSNSGSGFLSCKYFDPKKWVAITHLFLQCTTSQRKEIQDGGGKVNSRSYQERRLDHHDRSKGCLSFGTYLDRASSLSEIFVGRAVVQILVPSLRPELPHTRKAQFSKERLRESAQSAKRWKVYSNTVVKYYWHDVSNNLGSAPSPHVFSSS